ncbi:acyl-CoA thioesterase [Pseudomonas sp. PDM31]|uniref:acyl-CoA thioesterase n=1 Tax=Pseudomonas sp. PDM31 TaxID=2854778 RepID=UPI001C45594C|nr:acyl-CoA thioesterase [Pseudomonas sp. PDM31]
MTKETEAHRLLLENYPHHLQIETQFSDMDVHGHINNLSIGRYLESARARFQIAVYAGKKLFQRDADYAMLLVESNIRFLAECNFPDPVIVGTALGRIGNSSYQFQHGLFQNGICVALGEAVMVCAQHGKSVTVPDDLHAHMRPMLIRGAH